MGRDGDVAKSVAKTAALFKFLPRSWQGYELLSVTFSYVLDVDGDDGKEMKEEPSNHTGERGAKHVVDKDLGMDRIRRQTDSPDQDKGCDRIKDVGCKQGNSSEASHDVISIWCSANR